MKIVHIIYDSIGNPWLGGGGATRTHEIYKRLAKNHEVVVLSGNHVNALNCLDNITYKHIGLKKSYFLSRWSFIAAVWMMLPFMKADIFVEDIGAPGPLLVTSLKNKSVGSVQFLPTKAYVEKRNLLGRITYRGYSFGLRFYKNIITVSSYAASYLKDFAPNSNLIIIPNGVDIKKPQMKKSGDYIAFLGRIDIKQKGLDTLLLSLKGIAPEKIKIKIAGTGEESQVKKLKEMIKSSGFDKQIEYIGEVKGSAKERFIAESKCIVLPSRNETFGMSLIEAFVYSKPVIASNVGGMTELINESKAGIVFEDGDANKLAAAIQIITNSEELAAKLGQAGYDFAKNYTWDKIAKDYEKRLFSL
jgi:glycosyltransferase involved in cell wall biosynthesis